MLFCFCGTGLDCTWALFWRDTVSELPLRPLFHGWKSSASSSTKLLGNSPTMRRSRFNRPIHHEPSPALSTSIRSPSMNPRSRLVCGGENGCQRCCNATEWRSQPPTHLSAPRVYGLAPAREARRQRLSCHACCALAEPLCPSSRSPRCGTDRASPGERRQHASIYLASASSSRVQSRCNASQTSRDKKHKKKPEKWAK